MTRRYVVGLDPVHRLREAPEVVAAPRARHLRPLDAHRSHHVRLVDIGAQPVQGPREDRVHELAVVGPGRVVLGPTRREIGLLARLRLVGRLGRDLVPGAVLRPPLLVERLERAVPILEPLPEGVERPRTEAVVHGVREAPDRELVPEVVEERTRRGAGARRLLHVGLEAREACRVVEAGLADEVLLVLRRGVALPVLVVDLLPRVEEGELGDEVLDVQALLPRGLFSLGARLGRHAELLEPLGPGRALAFGDRARAPEDRLVLVPAAPRLLGLGAARARETESARCEEDGGRLLHGGA